jgi:class 3 adenylate cyclase
MLDHDNPEGTQLPSILIADDTPSNLQFLAHMLQRQGYQVHLAADGSHALETAQSTLPDLILLDVVMPDIDGYEVCKRLKANARTRQIPVIFLSALGRASDKVRAFVAGGVDYITKPFQTEEVLVRVATHMAMRELQRKLEIANRELEKRVAERTAELIALNAAYERFVPQEFLNFLQKQNVVEVKLGDHVQREMTIMFSDIRDFTARSENMAPQENFNFLNDYLGRVSPVICQHGGIIDKYLGDGIMALFPGTADNALQAAIAIQRAVADYNAYLQQSGRRPISTGTGLHTGSLILGIIGDTHRMQGTVISDAVNLAARLEEISKIYGASIIASTQTLLGVADAAIYHYRFVDKMRVEGKREPVSIFEIFDGEPETIIDRKLKTQQEFEEGVLLYHKARFQEARRKFEWVLGRNPVDRAAQLYLRRAAHFMRQGDLVISPGARNQGRATVGEHSRLKTAPLEARPAAGNASPSSPTRPPIPGEGSERPRVRTGLLEALPAPEGSSARAGLVEERASL